MTRCLQADCARQPVQHYAWCEAHLRALLARVFGGAERRLPAVDLSGRAVA